MSLDESNQFDEPLENDLEAVGYSYDEVHQLFEKLLSAMPELKHFDWIATPSHKQQHHQITLNSLLWTLPVDVVLSDC